MARYTYVISDIHGQYDAFLKMLEIINFQDEDEMYIIGDIIDRGPKSLECLSWIDDHDNVLPMLGNHELLFVDNYIHNQAIYNTISQAKERYSSETIEVLASWMNDLPECKLIKVNNQNFFLCHTQAVNPDYFKDDITDRLFPDYDRYKTYYNTKVKDIISIFGHIPTMQMRAWYEQEKSNKIWKNCDGSIIDIDCGAGYPDKGGCLGCLRLNDMKEYYVDFIFEL